MYAVQIWGAAVQYCQSSLLENNFVMKVMKRLKEHIHQITDTYDLDKERITVFLK